MTGCCSLRKAIREMNVTLGNRTFKKRALELLCEAVDHNYAGETVGRSYGEICAIIAQEFPNHRWDFRVALRWYVYKVREGEIGGYVLPQRRPSSTVNHNSGATRAERKRQRTVG